MSEIRKRSDLLDSCPRGNDAAWNNCRERKADCQEHSSTRIHLSPGLLLEPAEAWLPSAVGELAEQAFGFVAPAKLLQIDRAVPEGLSVGRLGGKGFGVGAVGQFGFTLIPQRLGQALPRGGFVGVQADRRRQIIPS